MKRGDGLVVGGRFGAIVLVNDITHMVTARMFPSEGGNQFPFWTFPEQVAAMGSIEAAEIPGPACDPRHCMMPNEVTA